MFPLARQLHKEFLDNEKLICLTFHVKLLSCSASLHVMQTQPIQSMCSGKCSLFNKILIQYNKDNLHVLCDLKNKKNKKTYQIYSRLPKVDPIITMSWANEIHFYFIFIFCLPVSLCNGMLLLAVARKKKKISVKSPRDSCELPCGCWESNLAL